jgi:hypothetical protein
LLPFAGIFSSPSLFGLMYPIHFEKLAVFGHVYRLEQKKNCGIPAFGLPLSQGKGYTSNIP